MLGAWRSLPPPIVAVARLAAALEASGMTHMERVTPPPPPRQTSASTDEPKPPPQSEPVDSTSVRFSLLELD